MGIFNFCLTGTIVESLCRRAVAVQNACGLVLRFDLGDAEAPAAWVARPRVGLAGVSRVAPRQMAVARLRDLCC